MLDVGVRVDDLKSRLGNRLKPLRVYWCVQCPASYATSRRTCLANTSLMSV